MDLARDILSVGRLACDLQVSVPRLRQLLADVGVHPAIRINGIDHFDATVADQLFPILHPEKRKTPNELAK